MITIQFNEQQFKNLITFLDRIEYKGLTEVQAISDIMFQLNNVKDNKPIGMENDTQK
ncbi:hypothetical protein [Paenibacillus dendritiformis]|uniref:hypothetical protein n=1 Tax=Paenibacillus dendritiformis TaxID=130049 RepID=UPI00387E0AE5